MSVRRAREGAAKGAIRVVTKGNGVDEAALRRREVMGWSLQKCHCPIKPPPKIRGTRCYTN